MKNLILIASLLFTFPALTSANNFVIDPDPSSTTENYQAEKIFFNNDSNDLLFVDLETINEQIVQINVLQNDIIMMEEDVAELPQNTIHEVELTFFNKGTYTIELVTQKNVSITKQVTIQ